MEKKVAFHLQNTHNYVKINYLVDEVIMSFNHRAKAKIITEEYTRSGKDMIVSLHIEGEETSVNEAIKETKWIFNQWCEKVVV